MIVSEKSKIREIVIDIVTKEVTKVHENDTLMVTEGIHCLRRSFYQRKYKKVSINKRTIEGMAIHYWIEYLLKKYNVLTEENIEQEYEVTFDSGLKVMMKPDLVLDDRVVDIKTTDREQVFMPDINYLLQVNFYAFVLGKPKFEILYITKNFNPVSFVEDVNVEMFLELLKRLEILWICLKKNKLPNREMQYCRNCEFYGICYKQTKLVP